MFKLLFQSNDFNVTVKEYMEFFADIYHVPSKEQKKRIAELLEFVGLDNMMFKLLFQSNDFNQALLPPLPDNMPNKEAAWNSRQLKRQIGYMPDFFGVYDNLTVKEYMEILPCSIMPMLVQSSDSSDKICELISIVFPFSANPRSV